MSELLTHEEYKSLGASLDFPQSPFIDGKYYKGSGALLATLNPSTGKELTSITTANNKDEKRVFEQVVNTMNVTIDKIMRR